MVRNSLTYKKYPGKWIVIKDTEVTASDESPTVAINQAKDKGIKIPFIVRIDFPDEPPFVL